jgi:putative peptide zinc metalloprotease protein
MATLSAERRIERTVGRVRNRTSPAGLWAGLARAAEAATLGTGDVWRGLERRLVLDGQPTNDERRTTNDERGLTSDHRPPATGQRSTPVAGESASSDDSTLWSLVVGRSSLWKALAERVDPTKYRPQAIPDVAEELVAEGDQAFTVIRSPRGNYLRLTDAQRDIWHAMDGTRTVAQLATQAFFQRGVLLPVGDLTAALKAEGFLMDPPVGMYHALGGALADRSPEGWGRRTLRFFSGKTWPIPRVDPLYGAIYRAGGRLLFTRAFAALAALLTIAGLVAFVLALASGAAAYQVISLNGSVALGLAALWTALLVSLILHESAHALAVKHYGRTIHGGGLMLYYGLPAAYVDTSDIWRSDRRARIAVSAAGPAADLLVGSLAALAALALPGSPLGALAFKLAFTSYASTLFNLNPLLELDGYFILVDLLRLPDLRRRSFAFIRGPLWRRLTTDDRRPTTAHGTTSSVVGGRWSVVERLTREERIFAWYGLAAAVYTLFAIGAAALFYWDQVLGPALALLAGDLGQRLLGGLLLLLLVLPALAAALLAGWELGRAALGWLIRRGYGRRPLLLAALAALAALAITWATAGPWTPPWLWPLAAALLWIVALGALLALMPDYRGAAVAPALWALSATTVCAALAGVLRALIPQSQVWIAADGLAFVFLLLAGFAALLDVDLRQAPPRELIGAALLLMLSFVVGGEALFGAMRATPGAAPLVLLVEAAPAYFGALALALLLPHLLGLKDSRLFWSWALLWLAVLARTAAYVAGVSAPEGRHQGLPSLDVLSAALWAASWLVHLATLRQIAPDEIRWPHESSMSEAQRLQRGFQWSYAGCYRLLRAVYGARRARALDDRMDVLAATANWDVTLDRDRARIGAATLELPLDVQGARYAEVLRYVVGEIEQIAGAAFARRAIQAAYDALPWPERETAGRLCFPDTPWARELSGAFGDVRSGRLRLLRQVDLFLSCDDDELEVLSHGIQEQRAPGGALLLRAGHPAPGMWIVEAGEVVGTRGEEIVAELHRGQAFGAQELLQDHMAELTYRATVESSLLFIPDDEFRALSAERAPHAAEALESAATLQLLERVPLFANLPRNTLRGLAMVAEQKHFEPRAVIVRQGVPSGMFYIIRQGRAAVLVRSASEGGRTQVRRVAQLGAREFFGELELLRGTPPVAHVVTVTPLVALALPHTAIHALLLGDGAMARGLEQIGTGRLMALRAR